MTGAADAKLSRIWPSDTSGRHLWCLPHVRGWWMTPKANNNGQLFGSLGNEHYSYQFEWLNCFERSFNLQIVPWVSLHGWCMMRSITCINKKGQCLAVLVPCTFRLNSKHQSMAGKEDTVALKTLIWATCLSQNCAFFAVDTIKYVKWLLKCKC